MSHNDVDGNLLPCCFCVWTDGQGIGFKSIHIIHTKLYSVQSLKRSDFFYDLMYWVL